MDQAIFTQLTLVLVIAAGISLAMRLLKQPLIMGYILTGIVVGPALLNLVHEAEAFQSFSQIGITLLLFIIGLGMNPAHIRGLGKPVLLTAGAILLLVGSAGFITSELMGLSMIEGALLGLALFFSSTIIILKIISDKRELSRLYAQISVGVIVVDDIVATLALLVVSALATSGNLGLEDFGLLALKGLGLVAMLYIMGAWVMPRLSRLFASAQELLFLFAIAWGFGVATLFSAVGFSYEVGALFAGISLASLPYSVQMGSRLKPLRDFFVVLFFVHLGESFAFGQLGSAIWPALILSAIVIIGKPLVVMSSLGLLGYTRLTSFKAGVHLSQISEFSMILIVLAYTTGLVSEQVMAITTLVAIITIGISTYLMQYDDVIYSKINKWLHIFEHKKPSEKQLTSPVYDAVLFGYSKGGREFISLFRELKQHYVVVEYDPEVIDTLASQGIRYIYGDATDAELLEEMSVANAQLVVSVITEHSVNVMLAQYLKQSGSKAQFVCYAGNLDHADELYEAGAVYVMLPHYVGTERLSSHMKKHGMSAESLKTYREKHVTTHRQSGAEDFIEASLES